MKFFKNLTNNLVTNLVLGFFKFIIKYPQVTLIGFILCIYLLIWIFTLVSTETDIKNQEVPSFEEDTSKLTLKQKKTARDLQDFLSSIKEKPSVESKSTEIAEKFTIDSERDETSIAEDGLISISENGHEKLEVGLSELAPTDKGKEKPTLESKPTAIIENIVEEPAVNSNQLAPTDKGKEKPTVESNLNIPTEELPEECIEQEPEDDSGQLALTDKGKEKPTVESNLNIPTEELPEECIEQESDDDSGQLASNSAGRTEVGLFGLPPEIGGTLEHIMLPIPPEDFESLTDPNY